MYIGLLILVLILCILFIVLGTTADDFFCKALDIIVEVFHLSESIAAVTLLAFGNGSADIFTSIAGALNGNSELVFAELLGSGVFVTTLVVGVICIMQQIYLFGRPFIRDAIFYIIGVTWIISSFNKNLATSWETSGFLFIYVIYFIIVLTDRPVRKSLRASLLSEEEQEILRDFTVGDDFVNWEREYEDIIQQGKALEKKTLLSEFFRGLNPIKKEHWKSSGWFGKFFIVIQSPILFIMKLLIPTVDETDENQGWAKPVHTLNCITLPVYGSYACGLARKEVFLGIPFVLLVIIMSSTVSAFVFFTSEIEEAPSYYKTFAFLTFFGSMITIYLMASEVVSLLRAVGIVCHISEGTLGMTVLAWGNSLGDVISILAVVRAGFPRMGLAACFGGPVFNTLLGVGVGFTVESERTGSHKVRASFGETGVVCMFFLFISLLSSLIAFPIMRFQTKRGYGIYLILLYGVFLIVTILDEAHILDVSGMNKQGKDIEDESLSLTTTQQSTFSV